MRAAAVALVAAGLFLGGVLGGIGESGRAGTPPPPVVLEGRGTETPGVSGQPAGQGGVSPSAGETPLDVQEVQHEVEYGNVADYQYGEAGDNSGPGGGEGNEGEGGGDSSGSGSDSSGSGSSGSGSDGSGSDSSGSGSSGSGSSGSGSGLGSGEPDHE